MHALLLQNQVLLLRRREDASSGGGMGCFIVLMVIGIVVFLIMRGIKDRREQLGASQRPMGSGPVEGQTFACPYPKCPTCGASSDKMKQQWDGLRKVTWSCGYCGGVAGVQELRDEELPASARQRLGLDNPQGLAPGQPGYYPPQQGGMGGGMGGLLTGMMIGNMLGGSHHDHDRDGWGGGGSGSGGGDWGDGGGSNSGGGDWGDGGGSSDSGGDWGDSGGGDSGGGDF
jgi:hypothetical protein